MCKLNFSFCFDVSHNLHCMFSNEYLPTNQPSPSPQEKKEKEQINSS